MAITNASRLADFGSGIGTAGAVIQIDNANQRVGIGTNNPLTTLQVAGIVSATSFTGNLTGNVTGNLTGTASTATAAGTASTATFAGTASTATFAGTAYGLAGSPNIIVGIVTASRTIVNESRVLTGAEKVTRINGNSATLTYNSSSSNIGLCTNPSGDVTLNVINIPTTSDFDDYALTFAVIVTSTGTARTCTAVTLNGVSKPIKWAGGSLSLATAGVTTTNGQTIFTFTGINTVGSASTTDNYLVIGAVSGGFF